MGLAAALERLPPGYRRVSGERGELAVLEPFAAPLIAAGLGPDDDGDVPEGELAGRRPLGELVVAGERLVVRSFHHGGMLRWIHGRRFLEPARPFEELSLAHALSRKGVLTPEVVAARAQRAPVAGWRLALVTRRVEGATDSSHALEAVRDRALGFEVARGLFEALGDAVGRLHAAGLEHTDLTPRNLLVEDSVFEGREARVWVLDLDRCVLAAQLSEDARRGALERLLRYLVRRDPRPGGVLSRARIARFLRAYGRARGVPPGCWKDDWRAVEALQHRGLLVHRLGWGLEGLFGGGPETRDGHRR